MTEWTENLSQLDILKLTNEERIRVLKERRVGEIKYNCDGEKMTLIDYCSYHKVLVGFDNGYKVWKDYTLFKQGKIKNRKSPSRAGVACCDIKGGAHKYIFEHELWSGMIRRSYSDEFKKKHPSYADVTCSSEWLYFSNFLDWGIPKKIGII